MSTVSTPMDPNVILEKFEGTGRLTDGKGHSFSEHMGSLIWPATISRPDISFAVARVGSYAANPSEANWTALKRIFRYLKGTMNKNLASR